MYYILYCNLKYRLLQVKSAVDVALEPNEMCCWGIQHVTQAQWWYHQWRKKRMMFIPYISKLNAVTC